MDETAAPPKPKRKRPARAKIVALPIPQAPAAPVVRRPAPPSLIEIRVHPKAEGLPNVSYETFGPLANHDAVVVRLLLQVASDMTRDLVRVQVPSPAPAPGSA